MSTLRSEALDMISRFANQDVTEQTCLTSDLNFDSIEVMNLVADMEDHFGVVIPMNLVTQIRTVGDATTCIESLMEAKGRADS